MVPVSNIKIPDNNVISSKIFLAEKVIPVAIQKDENNDNIYKILFSITQGINDKVMFLETRMQIEDNFDVNHIINKPIYLPNILANEKSREAYKKMMESFDYNNFYFGDFSFYKASNTNHIIRAYRDVQVNNKQLAEKGTKFYERMDIHVPRYLYIIFNLYLDNLMEPFSDVENIESFFVNKDLRNIKFEKIEECELIATCKTRKGETDEHKPLWSYNTHYEMGCGPTRFKFNYEIITEEDKEVKVPLDASLFMPEYSNMDKRFIGLVQDHDCYYIIIQDEDDVIKGLKITYDMLNEKTNLVNPYIIFKNYKPVVLSQKFVDKDGNPRAVKVGDKIVRPMTELDLLKMTHGMPINITYVSNDKDIKKKAPTKKK